MAKQVRDCSGAVNYFACDTSQTPTRDHPHGAAGQKPFRSVPKEREQETIGVETAYGDQTDLPSRAQGLWISAWLQIFVHNFNQFLREGVTLPFIADFDDFQSGPEAEVCLPPNPFKFLPLPRDCTQIQKWFLPNFETSNPAAANNDASS